MVDGLDKKFASLQVEDAQSQPDKSQQIITAPPTTTTNTNASTTPEILTTFTKFRDLPTEIRLLVWNVALATPRVIRARYCGPCRGQVVDDSIVPVGPNPMSIRGVCQEARKEARRIQITYYVSPRGNTRRNGGHYTGQTLYTIFVNPTVDTILMEYECLWPQDWRTLPHQRRIKNLAFNLADWHKRTYLIHMVPDAHRFRQILNLFEAL